MGAVFVAEQLSTGIQRALKLMHPGLVSDPQTFRRFEQEARVGASIQSDHVVQVVDAGVDTASGIPWLAMELLQGETLADALRRNGPMAWPDASEVISQLCHALGAAHHIGVVHRDLKPENVFLSVPRRQGVIFTVKVLDFGIAKILVEAQTSSATTSVVGTPLWMAPEQAERNIAPSPATDVWSLGLLVFTVLTSKLFWAAAQQNTGTITALLKEMLIDPIPSASARAHELGCAARIPPGFDLWFARCTARQPTMRFRDASEACAALQSVLPTPASGWPGASITPSRAPAPQPSPAPSAVAATTPAPRQPPSGTPWAPPAYPVAPTAVDPSLNHSVERGMSASQPGAGSSRFGLLLALLIGLPAVVVVAAAVVLFLVLRSPGRRPPGAPSTASRPVPAGTPKSPAADNPSQFVAPSLTLMVPAGPGSGFSYVGYLILYRYEGGGANYTGMWDKACLRQNMSPCSEAQWLRACEKEPLLAGSPSWTMTIQDGKVVVRGGDSCSSRKLVAPTDVDPARAVSCCSPAIPVKAEGVTPEKLVMLSMRFTALDTILTKKTPATKDFFAEKVTWLGTRDLERNQVLSRIESFLATNPRPWIVTETCDAQPDGDGVQANCRRYFYDSGKLQVFNTRMRMQSANLLFREVQDTGVVQSLGR